MSADRKQEKDNEVSTWLQRVQATGGGVSPAAPPLTEVAASGLYSLAGMGLVSALHFGLTGRADMTMILASMGASSVLIWGAPGVPFSHPRAVIGGHIVAASVGVTTYMLLGSHMWLAVPVACSGAIMAMQLTKTMHPPAGGTVLIAAMASSKLAALGYSLLCPVALTSSMLVAGGLLNNLSKTEGRCYPTGVGPQLPPLEEVARAGAFSFLGMGALSAVHFGLTGGSDMTMIIPPMGASAVLVWGAPAVPFSQPRNVIGGHIVSVLVGVTTYTLLGGHMWLAVPVATSCAIMAMQMTKTLHPPAGGTVLVALGFFGAKVSTVLDMGYTLVCPVALTSTLIVAGGVALNNLSKAKVRRYPTRWW